MTEIADWIAVDWGTSNLRAWLMSKDGVIGMVTSDKGMGALERDGFEPELLRLVGDYLPESGTVPVIACGMVGARQGWHEAPYVTTPCAAPGAGNHGPGLVGPLSRGWRAGPGPARPPRNRPRQQ